MESERTADQTSAVLSCKLCGTSTTPLFVRNGFTIVRCSQCGFMFADLPANFDPITVYDDDHYWTGGETYGYAGGYDGWWRVITPFYAARLTRIKTLVPGSQMLEVGCADGRFLEMARRQGFDVAGVEVSAMMRERCKARLQCRIFASVSEALADNSHYDCIAMFEVIEHLPDPLLTMRQIASLARSGGLLALSTPNFDCDESAQAPQTFTAFSPPGHLSYFGARPLCSCVERVGFTVVTVEPSFVGQEAPLPAPLAAALRPFRRGKRLRPGGLIGRILKVGAVRRALKMARRPEAMRLAETLDLYARKN